MSAIDIAQNYTRRGWHCVPIATKEKGPKLPGWQDLRINEAGLRTYFNGAPQNVGVLLGEASGGLIDVDLDHELARELADKYLPHTDAEFGRASSPRAHRLYRVSLDACEIEQHRLSNRKMIVEYRGTGAQTVFPGSIHPTGEVIEWNATGEPAEVDGDALRAAVKALADRVRKELGDEAKPQAKPAGVLETTVSTPHDPDLIRRRVLPYIASVPGAVSGQGGHDATYAVAQCLVNGFNLGDDEALRIFQTEYNPRCTPPWSDRELEHKVSQARKNPGEKRGWLLHAERPRYERSDFGAYDVVNGSHGSRAANTSERASESAVGLLELDPPSIVLDEGRTESAFSQRVHRNYGHKIRHVDEWNRFLVYNGLHWEVDQGAQLDAMIREQAARLFNEAAESSEELEPTDWRDLIRHAKAMNSARGVSATRALLPSEPGMSIAVSAMDRQAGMLNVQNGVIDLRTGELLPHDSSLLLTRIAPVEYDTQAQCPLWRKFIGEIFDDAELVDHIQKLIGYVLTASVHEQKLFALWGNGANGKSTLVEIVQSLLGTYATSAAPDLLLVKGDAHPTEIAALHGHRLVVCSETEEGRRLAEARVKLLTGGDVLSARRMREDYWNFPPVHKLFLLTNHKPQLRGTDAGIRRRLHLIPFRVTFTAEQQDRSLGRKLKAELPGILNWAIEGATRWFNEGLGEPAAVREATDAYIADQDIVGQYIADNCTVANWAKVRASSLFDNYRIWCEGQGEQAWTMKRFGQSIAERGFAKRVSNGTWYDGLCIRENE